MGWVESGGGGGRLYDQNTLYENFRKLITILLLHNQNEKLNHSLAAYILGCLKCGFTSELHRCVILLSYSSKGK